MTTEQEREYNRQYRLKHGEKLNAQRRAYRKSPEYKEWLERTRQQRTLKVTTRARVRRQASIESWLKLCLIAAKSRKRECSITLDDLLNKWTSQNGLCAVCKLQMTHQHKSLMSVSIDRKDSSLDYTNENTHLVARWVNIAKGDRPLQEIVEIVDQLRSNRS